MGESGPASVIRQRMSVVEALTGDLEHRWRYRALAVSTQGKSWALSGQEVIADPITRRVGYTNRARTVVIEPSRASGGYRLVFRAWGGGAASLRIGDPGEEELVGRETGRLAGFHEDGRKGPFDVVFCQRIGGGRDELLISRK